MASRIRRILVPLCLFAGLTLWLPPENAAGEEAGLNADPDWIGVIAGDPGGSGLASRWLSSSPKMQNYRLSPCQAIPASTISLAS